MVRATRSNQAKCAVPVKSAYTIILRGTGGEAYLFDYHEKKYDATARVNLGLVSRWNLCCFPGSRQTSSQTVGSSLHQDMTSQHNKKADSSLRREFLAIKSVQPIK